MSKNIRNYAERKKEKDSTNIIVKSYSNKSKVEGLMIKFFLGFSI